MKHNTAPPILMADDDEDDRLLTQQALAETNLNNPLYFVGNGQELLDFLLHRAPYQDIQKHPRPGLIFLDLNMPLMGGQKALCNIRAIPELSSIPIVVMTTSKQEKEVAAAYKAGANSFIEKPVSYDNLVQVLRSLGNDWFSTVRLP